MNIKDIKIDEEFKSILFPLSSKDYESLEKSLMRHGFSKSSPLIIWKGKNILVDGHNRYEICKKHNIPFYTSEEEFSDRDAVIDYILRMQLGRRNMNDFQRIEIALKYQEIISRKAKEKQSDAGKKFGKGIDSLRSKDPKLKQAPIDTNEELGKIAGVSRASVLRAKRILRDGTEKQIEEVRRGEKAISAITKELKGEIDPEQTKKCRGCGLIKPVSEFYKGKNYCKACADSKKVTKDIKGNVITISQKLRNMTTEEVMGDSYSDNREVEFHIDDLIDEVKVNSDKFLWSLENTFEIHSNVASGAEAKKKIFDCISEIINRTIEIRGKICEGV